ncbi:MAG: glycine zipper domain-containing protein [Pirellulales bacterium]
MRTLRYRTTGRFGTVVIALAAACVLAEFDGAHAQQYIYQPPPDYYQNDTAASTVVGGAFGAVTGAIIGGRKDRGEGALIGAGVGALTGNLLGRSKDRADEQRAAAGAAAVGQLNQQAAATAVTSYDLVNMTRAGVGDDLIISTMRTRGMQLDLSPQGIIALKQSGVSEHVVAAAQQMAAGRGYGPAPVVGPVTPVVTAVGPPPTTVIVAPGPWRPYHYHPYYYHRPRTYIHYGVGF